MKKYIHAMLFFSIISFTAAAQKASQPQTEPLQNPGTPSWLSDKGYWVVESNVNTPRNSIVHFYNNEHVLVRSEKIDGVRLNLNRKKILYQLKATLESAVWGFEKDSLSSTKINR